jgi:quercetin dioxygenase-like cupin family protein
MELRTPPATAKGPATTFTGDVWLDRFADGGDESRLVASTVRFTPGARTHWHSHPLGQTLHCTDGVGLVATRDGRVIILRPGQTVWTPPGEEHWHGATRDNLMCHLALVVTTPEGASATWLEAVTDEKYASAQAEVSAGLAEEPTP